jgi:hypothetical protein
MTAAARGVSNSSQNGVTHVLSTLPVGVLKPFGHARAVEPQRAAGSMAPRGSAGP